jgi:hypothetical protein
LKHIVVIASDAWRSIGSDSNEPVGSPRLARDDDVDGPASRHQSAKVASAGASH